MGMVLVDHQIDGEASQFVGKLKAAVFGGEGLFFATLRGPGHVWLQSLPISWLARRVLALAPRAGIGGGREEGSVLGVLGILRHGDSR